MASAVDWIARQLAVLEAAPARPPAHNPHPPGVPRPDGAAVAVLTLLREHPGRFFTRQSIMVRTQRTDKAVDWALLFLRAQGCIEALPDVSRRNPRYLRYRAVVEKDE